MPVGKPLTLEEYKERLRIKFPDYSINIITKSEIIKTEDKLDIECPSCKSIFHPYPHNFIKKEHPLCPTCSIKLGNKKTYLSEADFYKRIESKLVDGISVHNYKNAKEYVDITCKCGKNFSLKADSLFNRNNLYCLECNKTESNNRLKELYTMSHEEFIKNLNPDSHIIVLGKYENQDTKIKCKCSVCGYGEKEEWNVWPRSIKNEIMCPYCEKLDSMQRNRSTNEEYLEWRKTKYPDSKVVIIGKYETKETKLEYLCSNCGKTDLKYPFGIKDVSYCKDCAKIIGGSHSRLSKEEFDSRIKVIEEYGFEFIKPIDYSKLFDGKHDCKCKKCGHIWGAKPSNMFKKRMGCPVCKESKGEKVIRYYLERLGINFKAQFKFKDLKGKKNRSLPYDFGVLDDNDKLRFLIEFDGRHHYQMIRRRKTDTIETMLERLSQTKFNDYIKNKYCAIKDIPLLRIGYWEFKDIESIINNFMEGLGFIENNQIFETSDKLQVSVSPNSNSYKDQL